MATFPDVEQSYSKDRFRKVSSKIRLVLTSHGIDLNQPTPENGVENELLGESGRRYSITSKIDAERGCNVHFSSGEDEWLWNESKGSPGFAYLYYQKSKSQGEEVKEFGGYNTGETDRVLGKRNPGMKTVDVFEKFNLLVKDLSVT